MKKKYGILISGAVVLLAVVVLLSVAVSQSKRENKAQYVSGTAVGDPGATEDAQADAVEQVISPDKDKVFPRAGGVEMLLFGEDPTGTGTEVFGGNPLPMDEVAPGVVGENQGTDGEAVVQTTGENQEEPENEYGNLAIADVTNYVNVRSLPGTDGEIVGKIYDGAVAQIQEVAGAEKDWFRIVSGNVEGYIKAEFFLYGEKAAEVIEEYVSRYATVLADRLNVRKEPDVSSRRIGYVDNGETIRVVEDCGDWLRVQYAGNQEGYVAAEYVTVAEEFTHAYTLEEDRARQAAMREQEERLHASEGARPEIIGNIEFPATSYTSNGELRKAIVDYALQYVGYPYIHGGKSLAGGTDCSGFTCYIYADFGYSLSRTPGGQYSGAGRSISYTEIQPGDIICYSSNGGKSCTHVALYIGDGQIVHAANSKKGVIVGKADYSPIIGIRNVID